LSQIDLAIIAYQAHNDFKPAPQEMPAERGGRGEWLMHHKLSWIAVS
jgi:hypothetical protein